MVISGRIARWASAHPVTAHSAVALAGLFSGGLFNLAIGATNGRAFTLGLVGGGIALMVYIGLLAWIERAMRKARASDRD